MLNKLITEHDHILQTLNLLEMQYLDLCRGGTPDFSLMQSIIEYVQKYPENVHHPLEDMIFSILIERVDKVKLIQELMTEHADLEAETSKLNESLESLNSGVISREEMQEKLSAFLVKQRQHIYVEELKVYPLIQSHLKKKDWDHLQFIFPHYKNG